ncbi:MAG: substrate-binding domain-containing protein, partial [Candidatus Omnitrophica bacterium]|nr:substrate-binding domain-containing protein [Candidatus Omnitrophota bacterium]
MRKIVICLLISCICGFKNDFIQAKEEELKGTLTISGAWAIYPTAIAWAEKFQELHPKVKIDVSAGGAGKGAADAINGLVDIGMVSRQPDKAELEKGITPIYILHDAVFPIISENNPARD